MEKVVAKEAGAAEAAVAEEEAVEAVEVAVEVGNKGQITK